MGNIEATKKLALIANRNAGKGRVFEVLRDASRLLWGWPTEIFWPASIEELRETSRRLDPAEYEAAIVLGGDGTMNQFLRGMVETAVPLCVFPIGTANDLAGELGVRADWNLIQRLVDTRSVSKVDLLQVNGVPFLTVAGIGIGSILTREFNEKRAASVVFRESMKHLQSQVYTALAAKTILFRRDFSHRVHIQSNVFDEKLNVAAVFVCNQDRLAGNLRVALKSDNRDEMFSVLVIPQTHPVRLVSTLLKIKLGTLSPKDCILFATHHLKIKELKGRALTVFGDGETLVEDSSLEFKLLPRSLPLYSAKSGGTT